MRLMEARGMRVDALAVLGLAEGVFPSVERADPFLSEEVRGLLGMEAQLGQEQAGLFYQVVTRADRYLLLTRPYLAKDGESWEPSPYWNALQELLEDKPLRIHPDQARPLSEAASPNELLFWAARRWSQTGSDLPADLSGEFGARWQHIADTQTVLADRLQKEARGAYDGDLAELAQKLSQRYGERAGWSASRLEAYATCPFSFLVSSALGLEVIEAPQIGYQANQLGTILHAVLEQVYPEVPDPSDTAAVLAHLPEVARRVFATAPQDYQFRPSPLWETQQAELLLVLEATIQGIADLNAEQGWRPLAFEAKFGMGGQPPLVLHTSAGEIRLHGLVDRIDVNPDGKLRVIDYKSGSSHLAPGDLIDGRRLQLPIYALAASQALGLGEPAEGFYWKLFQGGASSLKLSSFPERSGQRTRGRLPGGDRSHRSHRQRHSPGRIPTGAAAGRLPELLPGRILVLALQGGEMVMENSSANLLDILGLTAGQREAAAESERNVAVTAGAGSGKTRTLVARYLLELGQGVQPRQVVAITFTEKAAREMRSRARTFLRQLVLKAETQAERTLWSGLDAQMDSARIGTIHSLCAEILRSHPAEARLDPQFIVVEESKKIRLPRCASRPWKMR